MGVSTVLRKLKGIFTKQKKLTPACRNCKHCRILHDIHSKKPYAARCMAIDSARILFSLDAANGPNNACVCYEFKEPRSK